MKTQQLVYGMGVNDLDEPVYINGKQLKFYGTWTQMLQRCFSGKSQAKYPTYIGCTVSKEWLSLSAFKVWFNANYRENAELDKDILVKGNKVYSPETCRFVPHYVNSLLTDDGAARGELPLGVRARKPSPNTRRINTTYEAQCSDGNGKKFSKTFRSIQEAAAWYSMTKKKVANEQATRALEAGDITEDVYQALVTREW